MCDLCKGLGLAKQSLHLAERGVELIEKWAASPLDKDGMVAFSMAALIHQLHRIGKSELVTTEDQKILEEAHGLFDRALVKVMREHSPSECSPKDQELVLLAGMLGAFVESAIIAGTGTEIGTEIGTETVVAAHDNSESELLQ